MKGESRKWYLGGVIGTIAFLGSIMHVGAWGDEGHKIVALIAENHLNEAVKEKVEALLHADLDTLTQKDIASRATWADRFRDHVINHLKPNYEATHLWHYVDIELDDPNFNVACFDHLPVPPGKLASEGPAKSCVADKIAQFWRELKDPTIPQKERQTAFKFLLHFVGDIHQPLHAADHQDRGGNDVKVLYGNRTVASNLHSYWDTAVVKKLGSDEDEIADRLTLEFAAKKSEWMAGTPEEWSWEGFRIAQSTAYHLPKRRVRDRDGEPAYRLSQDYEDDAFDTAKQQLAKAGMRLAMILNDALR